ncbi:MAG: cyclic nucleotide-binding domain-containing protein, partial [Chthoniobacterales bacterium]|nr:cyclic nucleotide-binding domain-containing protein [Chthoniobacterales bacterium]
LIELKAVGALSQVRHFREGDRIYSAGDEGEELFIINRGVAELAAEKAVAGALATVLSRGDIFGETGALMHLPRDHFAKARADLSVQCFRRSDFPELLRRVPSFFLFLSEKLATRLFQTTELVRSHSAALELTGSLANFDVVTIYQTILHSKQTGLLTIADDQGGEISQFYFERGTPRWGRFGALIGEEAFWQLFLHDDQAATFSFANGAANQEAGVNGGALSRQADEILINAIHMRDEFDDLRKRLRDSSATLRRKQLNLLWDQSALADLRPVAEAIWQIAYSRPVALSDLSRECKFCDLKIYKAVDEMVRSGLFTLESPQPERCLAGT